MNSKTSKIFQYPSAEMREGDTLKIPFSPLFKVVGKETSKAQTVFILEEIKTKTQETIIVRDDWAESELSRLDDLCGELHLGFSFGFDLELKVQNTIKVFAEDRLVGYLAKVNGLYCCMGLSPDFPAFNAVSLSQVLTAFIKKHNQ